MRLLYFADPMCYRDPAGHANDLFLVTSGFVKADVLEERLAEIDRRVKAAGPSVA